jgi:hypothetical protein
VKEGTLVGEGQLDMDLDLRNEARNGTRSWRQPLQSLEVMAVLAFEIVGTPTTSASTEHGFSVAVVICTDKRMTCNV